MNPFPTTINVTVTLAVSMTLLLVALLLPREAQAQVNVVVNGGSGTNAQRQVVTLNNGIRNLLQQLVDKEYEYDVAAERAANEAARNFRAAIEQGLQNGYRGSPIFIENLEVTIAQLEATTTRNVLDEVQQSGMCNAFKDEVLARLTQQYVLDNARTVAEKHTCQIDNVTEGNTEAFLAGDYEQGGINAMWHFIGNPEETPVGAYYETGSEIREEREEVVENKLTRWNWNRGVKDVYAGQQDALVCTQGEENGIRDNCVITKPGSIWFEQIVKGLNFTLDRAAQVDELDEDQTAGLFTDLARISTLPNNLAPTDPNTPGTSTPSNPGTGPGSPGTGDPTDPSNPYPSVPNDPDNQTTQSFLAQVTSDLNDNGNTPNNPIRPVLLRTLTKLQYQLETVALIDDTETMHASTSQYYADQGLNCYTLSFPNNFSNERTLTLGEIPFTIAAIKELYALFVRYEEAVANNQPTNQVLSDFQSTMQSNFAIPTEVDLQDIADKFNTALGRQINTFNQQHDEQVTQCELILNPPPTSSSGSLNMS